MSGYQIHNFLFFAFGWTHTAFLSHQCLWNSLDCRNPKNCQRRRTCCKWYRHQPGHSSPPRSSGSRYPLVNIHNYGKSPFFMGKSTINGDFPYSYVSLPEGRSSFEVTPHVWPTAHRECCCAGWNPIRTSVAWRTSSQTRRGGHKKKQVPWIKLGRLGVLLFFNVRFMYIVTLIYVDDVQGWGGVGCCCIRTCYVDDVTLMMFTGGVGWGGIFTLTHG